MPGLNSTPAYRDQPIWLQVRLPPEHWNMIRMRTVAITGIIMTAIADTITAQITTATEINI
jgi:hypothetical protein